MEVIVAHTKSLEQHGVDGAANFQCQSDMKRLCSLTCVHSLLTMVALRSKPPRISTVSRLLWRSSGSRQCRSLQCPPPPPNPPEVVRQQTLLKTATTRNSGGGGKQISPSEGLGTHLHLLQNPAGDSISKCLHGPSPVIVWERPLTQLPTQRAVRVR